MVMRFQQLKECGDGVRGICVIGVHDHDLRPAGRCEPSLHGRPFAAVVRMGDEARAVLLGNHGTAVRGAVVDNDHFQPDDSFGSKLRKQGLQAALLVVGGDDQGCGWFRLGARRGHRSSRHLDKAGPAGG